MPFPYSGLTRKLAQITGSKVEDFNKEHRNKYSKKVNQRYISKAVWNLESATYQKEEIK